MLLLMNKTYFLSYYYPRMLEDKELSWDPKEFSSQGYDMLSCGNLKKYYYLKMWKTNWIFSIACFRILSNQKTSVKHLYVVKSFHIKTFCLVMVSDYRIYVKPADKLRSILDLVIFSSGICSLYKSRSSIGLKSLKILIIVVIREKADPVISNSWCQQVHLV